MAIVPDEKDWTWVLSTPCPECGYLGSDIHPTTIGAELRENTATWRPLLDHPAATVRPHPDQWSATEYACHVRDVFRVFVDRLGTVLAEDDPTFQNWDQDATALELRYDRQAPDDVIPDLEAAGAAIADAFDAVTAGQWERPAGRSDGARFTVATLGRYLLHDPVHHVWDVERGYRALG